ncbi:unnamed protein product [Protopolystoma xenopodis]|uniref:Uncharacterized protein n=1 Tax=Protopolystoma xenopodis TaxID=117903 RepID=A0A448WRR7_9PLAT|nr:unnamed protein product [Protopolystoma xenopodis]
MFEKRGLCSHLVSEIELPPPSEAEVPGLPVVPGDDVTCEDFVFPPANSLLTGRPLTQLPFSVTHGTSSLLFPRGRKVRDNKTAAAASGVLSNSKPPNQMVGFAPDALIEALDGSGETVVRLVTAGVVLASVVWATLGPERQAAGGGGGGGAVQSEARGARQLVDTKTPRERIGWANANGDFEDFNLNAAVMQSGWNK